MQKEPVEQLTPEVFTTEIEKLVNLFVHTKFKQKNMEAYWEELKKVDAVKFKRAVRQIIIAEPRFPAISTIFKYLYAFDWV